MKRKWMASLLCALALVFTCTACAGNASDKSASSTASYAVSGGYATEAGGADWDGGDYAMTEEAMDEAGAQITEITGDTLPQDGRKIIRNTSLTVETTEFDESAALLKQAVTQAGGYIEYSSQYAGGSTRSASYTCRIPAEQYGVFLENVRGAGSVVRTEESTQDATSQYIDLEARLKSLRTQENRLLELMENSGSLEELLAVQDKLSEVQYQIENYTGQMKALENRIDYSTVEIDLEEVETYTPIEPGFGERAAEAFRNMVNSVKNGAQGFVLLLIYVSPLILVAAVALIVVLIVVKRKKRRTPPQMPIPPQDMQQK